MAETLVTKSAAASMDTTTGMIAPQSSNDILGEDIAAPGVPLRMHTDGKLYRATAAAANASARIYGWSTRSARSAASPPPATPSVAARRRTRATSASPGTSSTVVPAIWSLNNRDQIDRTSSTGRPTGKVLHA
jgi:hypothetical protein